jgi:acyl-CoA dehydrogenase
MGAEHNIVGETTRRIFADLGDPQALVRAPGERWKAPLWRALEEAGLTRAWVPEALNGAGAGIEEGFEILTVSGAFAAAVPLAETLLAGWLLSRAKLPVPEGMLSVAPVRAGEKLKLSSGGKVSGPARNVPFARDAAHLAVLAWRGESPVVALVDSKHCTIEEGSSIAGDPRDDVSFDNAPCVVQAPAGIGEEALLLMGAAVRAAQMAGALRTLLERSAQYAKERVAFERPIGGFQAVQHNLARLAGETAAALAAAGSAAEAIGSAKKFDEAVFLEVAAAKIRVGEAAGAGAAIAHQTHGAIGFSSEHALHRYTQRLWAWRDDFGGESFWAARLGRLVAASGADALWPMLAAR